MPDPDTTMSLPRRAWSNPFRAGFRLLLITLILYSITSAYLLQRLFIRDIRRRLRLAIYWQSFWARCSMRILDWNMTVTGNRPHPGSLLTPNHVTYGDIPVLLASAGTFFVPKGEIAKWPLIGAVIRAMEHPFVSRVRSKSLRQTIMHIGEKLKQGQSVAVFLEGTTSQGNWVRPFLPSMLQPAMEGAYPIVPVPLVWRTTREGLTVEDDVAFWKDISFAKHAWRLLGLKGVEVEVRFGDPIYHDPGTGSGMTPDKRSSAMGAARKDLALRLHDRVVQLGGFRKDIPGSYHSLEETRKLFSGQ